MTKYSSSLEDFKEAVVRLEEGLMQEKNEFMRDAAIKRFEIAFDLSWKTLKAFLETNALFCASPLVCFKEGFRQGLLASHDEWVSIVEMRNKTVHTYDEKLAEEVYASLPKALTAFQQLLKALSSVKI